MTRYVEMMCITNVRNLTGEQSVLFNLYSTLGWKWHEILGRKLIDGKSGKELH